MNCDICNEEGIEWGDYGCYCSTKCLIILMKDFDDNTCDCCVGIVGT